jgi:hypothetical protein
VLLAGVVREVVQLDLLIGSERLSAELSQPRQLVINIEDGLAAVPPGM